MSISRDNVCDLHKDCPEGEDEEQDCGKCRTNFRLSLSILRVQQVKTFMPKQVMKVLVGGGLSIPCPGSFTPRKETWYPFYRRLVGPLGQPTMGAENLARHWGSIPGPSIP